MLVAARMEAITSTYRTSHGSDRSGDHKLGPRAPIKEVPEYQVEPPCVFVGKLCQGDLQAQNPSRNSDTSVWQHTFVSE